ncbi:dihydrolipoamide acetyltransferase family protein [Herbiconiux sp. KACC 21604]|uniref:dihydrolipoamide acetyltransferase family protein n=1 Tax=unclassified Herbiconiux TaxID=2618217 RepID=UPI0014921614|nr:dihydrolipoamide acetyltransferase family protein [Herbiconiux sp. SALV-R1]QJU54956.1 2-oxo acid dehydrogenase subunit E2 [Herbiconiux sp. SALV-R1]WPO86082.1 dihydrolipoamide acetyltransferase family protein [Herbiconiux sp. KACC 21604]
MSIDVRVPTTGNAGEDAVIVDWNVRVGDQVSAGEVLVTLETAKSTIEVEAPEAGEVLRVLFDSGDEVPEHEVLAIIGAAGELPAEGDAGPTAAPTAPAADAADPGATAPAEPTPAVVETARADRHRASPRARLLAERNGIDLSTVTGSGPGGRIIVPDVLSAKRATAPAATAAPEAAPVAPPRDAEVAAAAAPRDAEFQLVPVRGARKVTAQRMHASLAGTAQVTLTRYADATAMLSYVKRLRTVTEAQGLPKINVNDVLLFATAKAVAKHPEANSVFDWDGIRQYRQVHLGFAVDTGQALLVPVIPNADALSISGVAAAAAASIEKARSGKLGTAEMEGGTFTVSNLGSLGVHWFTPVLNTPQSCILGVGAAHQSHPDAPSLLPLSLTFDHRALDGAAAAKALASIAEAIETVDVLSAF